MQKCTVLILAFILFSTNSPLKAQEMTPEQLVQKQLETHSQGDINGFMSLIAENVTFYNFSDGNITMSGASARKEFYSNQFEASPNLHSTVLQRNIFRNKDIVELNLIYEIEKEKINKVTLLRKEI